MDRSVRSQFPSIKLDQLVYVELDAGNGGMMLTVSEEGFSFRAVSPVRTTSRTPFSFVIHGTQKLEGFGKIEWTKDEGKVAGLQFTDVTTQFLDALRIWLAQLCAPVSPPQSFPDSSPEISYRPSYHTSGKNNGEHLSGLEQPIVQQPTLEHTVAPQSATEPSRDTIAQPMSGLGMNFGQPALREERPRSNTRVAPQTIPAAPAPLPGEWSYPDATSSPVSNKFMITVATVCLLGLAILLYSYREVLGQTLISLGQKMSSASETSQTQTSKASDAAKPEPETQQAPTAGPTTSDSQKALNTQPQSGSVNNSRYNVGETLSATKPDSTFQDARAGSAGTSAPGKEISASADPAGQVRSLWSAVSQGSTSAEVTLAKLYLIGGGVPKSCDQAKVLLQAAAKKGNGEAIDKLSQISQQGCP